MRAVCYISWLLLFASCAPTANSIRARTSSQDAESIWRESHLQHFQKNGLAAFNRGDLGEAAKHYSSGAQAALLEKDYFAAGRFLANLGAMQLGQLENRQALGSLLEARRLALLADDISTQQSVQANLANLYMQSGDQEAAGAAAAAGAALSPPAQKTYLRVRILLSFARVLSRVRGLAAAMPAYSQALQLADAAGDDSLVAECLDLTGFEYLRNESLAEAHNYLARAWTLRRSAQDPRQSITEAKLATLFRKLGQPARARFWIERALPAAVKHSRSVAEWTLWHERAQIAEAEGDMQAALAFHRMSISKAAAWREKSPPAERFRLSSELYLQDAFDGFLRVAGLQLSASQSSSLAEEMFAVVHFNRAWSLDSPRGQSAFDARKGTDTLLADARRLEARLLGGDLTVAPRLSAVRTSLAEAQITPAHSSASIRTPDILLEPSNGEAILTIHLDEPRSWLWLWTATGRRVVALPPRTTILNAANKFRTAVVQNDSKFREYGAELYQLLFGSLGPSVLQYGRWDIVTGDGLHQIPFAALIVDSQSNEPYLVQRVQIRLIPNAIHRDSSSVSSKSFLAVADPIFNSADPRFSREDRTANSVVHASQWALELPRLPGTAEEVRLAAAPLKAAGYSIRMLDGAAGSEESVLRELAAAKHSIIHFATHSVAPASDTDRIHLALSIRPDGSPGLLSADDISGCATTAELVVLSACRSAASSAPRGAALLGLTRAWLRAGANRVLATLWPVPDDNAPLFKAFYESIASSPSTGPLPVAEALRNAQLSAIGRGGAYASPSYWSGYVLLVRR